MSKHNPVRIAVASPRRPALALCLAAALLLAASAFPQPSAVALAAADAAATEQPPATQPPAEPPPAAQPAGAQPGAEQPATGEPAAEQPAAAPAERPAATEEAPAAPPPAAAQPTTPAAGEQTAPAAEQPAAPAEQTPATPTTPTAQPAPGTAVPAPGATVPAVSAAVPPAVDHGPLTMNFKDASLASVLGYLSEKAGLVIIPEVPISGTVTILALQPMSVDDAISSLNSALKMNGLAAVRMDSTLKIVTLDNAKTASIPVRTGNNPQLVPQSDEMVTWIIGVRYCDAPRLASDLAGLVPSYALLTANASSNSLVMTATCADIRRIIEIVHALDTQQAGVADVRVFRLKYADASAAAGLINQIFQQTNQASNQRGGGRAGGGFFFQRGGGGNNQQSQQQGTQAPPVLAAADTRTNTLVVSGPADTLVIVEGVINDLDSNPADEESVMVYALKNSDATNLTTVLNNLFSQSTSTSGGGRTTSTRGGTTSRFGNFGRTTGSTTNQALAGLTGAVYVVSDTDSNSLLIRTAPKNFELVRGIVEDLDRPVPQVLIKVLIAEVTHDDTIDLGAEFSVLNLVNGGPGTRGVLTNFGVAAQTQGLITRLIGGDTNAILRALESIGKLEVLSRPYILASDNQAATITVGDTVPFIQNTRTTDTGQTINTITYRDIGIIMNVTAHINPEGLVNMDVAPEISSISGTSVPISETVNAPVFTKRSAETHVSIKDGQTIVIGGLIEDSKVATITQVPILGHIPILGILFRRTINQKKKTELLIFLTPMVARVPETLTGISQSELAHTQNVTGAVRPGAFQEQLEGMAPCNPLKPIAQPCPPATAAQQTGTQQTTGQQAQPCPQPSAPAGAKPGATVTLPPVAPKLDTDP